MVTATRLDVLTFDFRGIGESLHGALKDSTASIVDWGLFDLPAAVDWMLEQTGAEKINLIGHSAGGQLLGVMHNYDKVAQLTAVAGSTGHVKGLKGKTKILGPIMFWGLFPLSNRIKGYAITKKIGMGENLPKRVAEEWSQFCSRPGYIQNAIGKTIQHDYHTDIDCKITSIWATDDEIATQENVNDLLRLYPNAHCQQMILEPQQYGKKQIGHMLMFKESYQALWPILASECL